MVRDRNGLWLDVAVEADTVGMTFRSARPDVTRRPRALAAIALALSAAGALVAGARDDSVTQSLVFAAAAFLCAALFWFTTAEGSAHTARRTRPALD